MSSNLTQAQRDLLNNAKQAVALVDKELERIREQRITVCLSGFELDWQLACIGAKQSASGPNKLGSMMNAQTDFQAALGEIHGPQSHALINGSSGSDPIARRLAASTPERSVAALPRPPSRKPLPTALTMTTRKIQTLSLRNVSLAEAQEPKPLSVQQDIR